MLRFDSRNYYRLSDKILQTPVTKVKSAVAMTFESVN